MLVLALLGVVALVAAAEPQEIDAAKAAAVKAAYLNKFASYVKWPDDAFESDEAPFVIGVVGEDPVGQNLVRTAQGQKVGEHPVVVRLLEPVTRHPEPLRNEKELVRDLKRCHVVFVSAVERKRCPEVRAILTGVAVLTVSDIEGFAEDDGMIEFVLEEGRIRLHINHAAARGARLTLSAKLLKSATIVKTKPRPATPE